MRLHRGLLLALLSFVIFAFVPQAALAIPVQPTILWGDITLAGAPAPDGLAVTARINGVTYATTTTVLKHNAQLNKDYRYYFQVPADDSDTSAREGGVTGDIIQLYVDQALTAQTTFGVAKIEELNLAVPAGKVLAVSLALNPPAPIINRIATATGVVKDRNGLAIAGAAVTIEWGDGGTGQSVSGGDGSFTFDHTYAATAVHTVTVTAVKDGFIRTGTSVSAGVTLPGIVITLAVTPTAANTGQQITAAGLTNDQSGAPVSETALSIGWGDGASGSGASVAGGSFSFGHNYSAAGSYVITVTGNKPDYLTGEKSATIVISTPVSLPGTGGGQTLPPVLPKPEDIEKMTTSDAVNALSGLPPDVASGIVEKLAPTTAAGIIATMPEDKAALILENLAPEVAARLLQDMADSKVAGLLAIADAAKAASIMEKMTAEKLTNVIPGVDEASLLQILPMLTPDKLYSIPSAVLFQSLPSAPTEQLVSERPPLPAAGLPAPAVVYSTPTGARYLAIKSLANEWVLVMATPEPLDRLLLKTTRELANIGTMVIISPGLPQGVASVPAGKTAYVFFDIGFENAPTTDIALGHITFKLAKSWLQQNSIAKWSVALSWYSTQLKQWLALPTKRVGEDGQFVYYSAVVTHFTTFAVLGSQSVVPPQFRVSNLAITPVTAQTGAPVIISADVTNTSGNAGTYAATLWLNGTVEAGKNVTLQAGETAKVAFSVPVNDAGSYEVRVDRLLGSFQANQPVATSTPVLTPTPTPGPTSSLPPPSTTPPSTPPPMPSPLPTIKPTPPDVTPAPTATPTPALTPTSAATPAPSVSPVPSPVPRPGVALWVWLIVVMAVLGTAAGVAMLIRRRRG